MRKTLLSTVALGSMAFFSGRAQETLPLVFWDDCFDKGAPYRYSRGRGVSVAASKRAAKKRANLRKRSPK